MYTIKLYICKVELALSVQFCTNVRTYITTFDNCVQNVYITQNSSLCLPPIQTPAHSTHTHFSHRTVASPKEQGLFSGRSPSALLCLACFTCSNVLTVLRDSYGHLHMDRQLPSPKAIAWQFISRPRVSTCLLF